MRNIQLYALIFTLALSFGCKRAALTLDDYNTDIYTPQYASGFEIKGAEDKESVVLVSHNPWQGADGVDMKLFISRNGEQPPQGFDGQVLTHEPKRIICMSSTHIAMLDAMDETDRVVGVSGIDFISNPKILSRKQEIGDVGYDSNIDFEMLLGLSPDIVLLYGVNGNNAIEKKLRELKIPFAYIGEYLEDSPLGKAEWMVAISEIIGKRDEGIEVFEKIPKRYQELKQMADSLPRPTVMVNTPYGDSWIMPSTSSYVVQLIRDAGAEYVYNKNNSNRSTPIDMEQAYLLASNADFWIDLGRINSLQQLVDMYPKFADTKPVVGHNVYNNNRRSTQMGGNDYYESGLVHPELVLQDLIKVFHPELLDDQEFTYYKNLSE